MQQPEDKIKNFIRTIGATPPLAAMWRMEESASQNSLFDDPYARHLVQAATEAGWRPAITTQVLAVVKEIDPWAVARLEATKHYASVRTRFFDDFLRSACADNSHQIVIIAAGLDTRAWRLSWPEQSTIYEIDRPEVLAFKAETLQRRGAKPAARYVAVGTGIRRDWSTPLLESGFNRSRRTVWLVEGLQEYLFAADRDDLFGRVNTLSSAGDWLGVETLSQSIEVSSGSPDSDMSSPHSSGPRLRTNVDHRRLYVARDNANVPAWLAQNHWKTTLTSSLDAMAHYGRLITGNAHGGAADTVLVVARRY